MSDLGELRSIENLRRACRCVQSNPDAVSNPTSAIFTEIIQSLKTHHCPPQKAQ
jgi:hypothetical protein